VDTQSLVSLRSKFVNIRHVIRLSALLLVLRLLERLELNETLPDKDEYQGNQELDLLLQLVIECPFYKSPVFVDG